MPSPEELRDYHAAEAARHLNAISPGRYPLELFRALKRHVTQGTVELVCLRGPEDEVEGLMTQRSPDDPDWPDMWHVPGSVIDPDDDVKDVDDYHEAFERVLDGELDGSLQIVEGPFKLTTQLRPSPRGLELAVVHWAQVTGDPSVERFFNVEAEIRRNPPAEGIIRWHAGNMLAAADEYRDMLGSS